MAPRRYTIDRTRVVGLPKACAQRRRARSRAPFGKAGACRAPEQGRLKQTLLGYSQGKDARLACHKRPVPTCAPQLVSSPQYRNEPTTTIMFGTDGQKL